MSIRIEDYIPFDYMRYAGEILPALEQATRGNTIPLSELITSATHFSLKLRSKYALPLPEDESNSWLWPFEGLFDASTLRRIKSGEAWDPWKALATVVPTLEGKSLTTLGKFGEMLKFHLFATFCCEVPPWLVKWPNPYAGFASQQWYDGEVIWHEEVTFVWNAYCARDKEMQALWGAFYRPAPPDLMQLLHIHDDSSSVISEYTPRYMNIFSETEKEMSISGFITLEEIQHLLEHVRIHERPVLDSIIDDCIRYGESRYWAIDIEALSGDAIKSEDELAEEESWHYIEQQGMYIKHRAVFEQWKKVHPVEMEAFLERNYQLLHMVEDEILHRMRFAAERGWGILIMDAKL
jgi:hypothetical protein